MPAGTNQPKSAGQPEPSTRSWTEEANARLAAATPLFEWIGAEAATEFSY